MSQAMSDIQDFHKKFGLAYEGPPRILPADIERFRIGFMQEELDEFGEACAKKDLVKAADALGDLMYVLLGTAYLMGLPLDEIFEVIHAANMTKVRAVDIGESKRGSTFDVVKPPGFVPPDKKIALILKVARLYAEENALGLERMQAVAELNKL